MLRALLSILLLVTALNVFAANPASPSTTPLAAPATTQNQALEDDINKLKLDIGILEKRVDDFSDKQANQIALLSNQSSYLGLLIAMVSVLITVLAVGAGFFVHNRTEKVLADFEKDKQKFLTDAKQEAEAAIQHAKAEAEKQFKSHEDDLKVQLNELIAETKAKADRFDAYLQSKAQQIADQVLVKDAKATPEQLQDLDLLASMTEQNAEQTSAKDLYIQAIKNCARQNYLAALDAIEQALNPSFATQRNDLLNTKLLFVQGLCHHELDNNTQAIQSYQQLEQRFADDKKPVIRKQLAKAMVNLGFTYGESGQTAQAIETYQRLEQRFADDKEPAIRQSVAKAMVNLGFTYGESGQTAQAIETYQRLEQRFADDKEPTIRELLAKAMLNLGITYGKSGQTAKEIETYLRLEQQFADDKEPAIRERIAKVQNGLGFEWIMQAKQRPEAERIPLLQQALNKLQQALASCADEDRAMVLGNIGYAHFLLGDTAKAERYTRDCLQPGGEELYLGHQEDAKQHRLEPQDSDYEAMLHRLWHDIQQTPDKSLTAQPPAG